MRFLVIIPAALVLTACAQSAPETSTPKLAASQCAYLDWREAGWQDGAAGLTQAAFDERAAICKPEGVEPDSDAYFAGRVEGLQAYCAPTNGYRLGLEGAGHTSICPPGLREAFLAEFERGQADRARAGTGQWRRGVGGGVRIGAGTSGRSTSVGISIGR